MMFLGVLPSIRTTEVLHVCIGVSSHAEFLIRSWLWTNWTERLPSQPLAEHAQFFSFFFFFSFFEFLNVYKAT